MEPELSPSLSLCVKWLTQASNPDPRVDGMRTGDLLVDADEVRELIPNRYR